MPAPKYLMFEQLPTVPTSQELLDRSFRRASRAESDFSMVQTAGNILSDKLSLLIKKFPSFDKLPAFYREMADIIAGIDDIRISLSRLRWASRQIRQVTRESVSMMKRSSGQNSSSARKAAFGRFSSIMKSIEKDLVFLDDARNKLRKMPTIDPSLPTVLIAGYPNVGKSSFITRITGARPEIASYPFTTKGILVGHFSRDDQKYQVVDTPGLLDRPMSERNEIERQTVAALGYLPGVVLFILDPSEHCGYPLESQLSLVEDLRGWMKLPMLVVANKTDILRYPDVPEMSTYSGQGVNEILERLLEILDSRGSEI
jgi:nucleolar GTP-binding protein